MGPYTAPNFNKTISWFGMGTFVPQIMQHPTWFFSPTYFFFMSKSTGSAYPSRQPEFISRYWCGWCCSVFSLICKCLWVAICLLWKFVFCYVDSLYSVLFILIDVHHWHFLQKYSMSLLYNFKLQIREIFPMRQPWETTIHHSKKDVNISNCRP